MEKKRAHQNLAWKDIMSWTSLTLKKQVSSKDRILTTHKKQKYINFMTMSGTVVHVSLREPAF